MYHKFPPDPPGWSDDLLLQFSSWLSSSHVLPLCNHHPYHRQWDSKLLLHFQSIGLKLKTTRCLKPKMTKAYRNSQGQSPHCAIKNIFASHVAQWTPKTTKLVAVKSNRRGDQGSTRSTGSSLLCATFQTGGVINFRWMVFRNLYVRFGNSRARTRQGNDGIFKTKITEGRTG